MSRAQDWWQKWGSWVGPTSIMAILAIVSRFEACQARRETGTTAMLELQARIASMEKRQDATDRWVDEHNQVATARIAQLEALDKVVGIDHELVTRIEHRMAFIEADIRDIRDRIPPRRTGGAGAAP